MDAEILVADPDPASSAALRDLLAPLGRIREAHDGDAMIAAATLHPFAAILLDGQLLDGDGLELLRRLRGLATSRDVPVLLLDRPAAGARRLHAPAAGPVDFVTKPVDEVVLRAKLEVLLTLHRRGLELRHRDALISAQHTEIERAHAALEEATAAVKVKDLYMGVLGHDLRSPLGAISIAARMMLMRGSLGADDRDSVFRIARSAERMAALIRDILDYTRGQATGGLPVIRRPNDMGEICSSIVEEITILHADRAIDIDRHGDLRGSWDRERVEQVVSNLVINALTHGRGAIRIALDGLPSEVVMRVHNGGLPIPADQLPTLFQPFRRGSESRMGLGLGLYIVSEILRAHDGTVQVESTAERGTTFISRWPRVPEVTT